MAMTPEEVKDAFEAYIYRGDRSQFEVVLDQLRSGELVIERTNEGHVIRAAT